MGKLTPKQIETARDLIYRGNLENHIEELARVLQYAPTEPAAPLTPQEKDEIWHDLRIPCRDIVFARVDEVLAKRPTVQPFASTAQADWEDQHRGTQPAPVDSDLVERAIAALEDVLDENIIERHKGTLHNAVSAVIRLIQQDSNARWSKAAAAYLLDEHGWNVSDALFASSKIRARVEDGSLPPTLQERITKRFQQVKLVNGAAWDPNTLVATVMEEIAKETK